MVNRALVLTLTLATFLTVQSAGESIAQDTEFTGVYRCEGQNADGSLYHAVVEISKVDESYRVQWTLAAGRVHVGLGIAAGDLLAVSYYGDADTGIIVYRIDRDGEHLVGRWTAMGGRGAVFGETLTKVGTIEPAEPLPRQRPAGPVTPAARAL